MKELESSAIKRAAKELHDNPYYSNFLDTLEVDTGVQVRFTDDKKEEFLKTLIECHGFPSIAGNRMGFYFGSIQYAMKKDPMFAQAVEAVRSGFTQERLDGMEEISFEQAKKAGCVTERIFQLKAHDPEKYRERTQPSATQVNVMVAGITPKDRAKVLKKEFKVK